MTLNEEIEARIERAKVLGKAAAPSDFQVRVAEKGAVLINLKTSRATLIYDDSDPFAEDGSIAQ